MFKNLKVLALLGALTFSVNNGNGMENKKIEDKREFFLDQKVNKKLLCLIDKRELMAKDIWETVIKYNYKVIAFSQNDGDKGDVFCYKKDDNFLILNIKQNSNSSFNFFEEKNLLNYIAQEPDVPTLDWDNNNDDLLTFKKNIFNNEKTIKIKLIINSFRPLNSRWFMLKDQQEISKEIIKHIENNI